MAEQRVIWAEEGYSGLESYFEERSVKKVLLVCDNSLHFFKIAAYLKSMEHKGMTFCRFEGFTSNPRYEEVVAGVELFRKEECDMIFAVGGGSAIDVAKCIKLYANMDGETNYLEQTIEATTIPFVVMPTTAGTGSEATRYAVIYYNGEKQSVTHNSCIPDVVLLDASVLYTLPLYQKKATMLDALCHAIESFWSVNSTEESREYSAQAVSLVMKNYKSYLKNEESGCKKMLLAANIAGKAINITQTTAGHAMCYKMTSLYGIAHGHAAALCVATLWPYMLQHTAECIDPRGKEHLERVLDEIASAMEEKSPKEAAKKFLQVLRELGIDVPHIQEADYEILKKSVNPVRLKNNPVRLTEEVIDTLYRKIEEKRTVG